MKLCKYCDEEKPLDGFYNNKKAPDGKASRCKECNKAYCKDWHANNREKSRATAKKSYDKNSHKWRLATYNLTEEEFDSLVESQDGKCAICKQDRELHIDHCHNLGNVRGLLCLQCNTALGLFDDDVERLKIAIEYLLK